MYDDTVANYANSEGPEFAFALYYRSPKIEPEIVSQIEGGDPVQLGLDAAGDLQHVEWIALGFRRS